MKTLFGLVVGFLLGFMAFWYLSERNPEVRPSAGVGAISEPESSNDIRGELSRTGKVIREKAEEAGDAIKEAADNAGTTAAIKAKLLEDPATSGLSIDVDTTDGVVTLSGKVSSHEEISRAMELAQETAGVRKVISALQVEGEPPPA